MTNPEFGSNFEAKKEIEKAEAKKNIERRFFALGKSVADNGYFYGRIRGSLGLLGGDSDIGGETVHNSPMQADQLIVSLALSHDPRIEELIANPKIDAFKAKNRIELLKKWGEILNHVKILDLGCGYSPTFARAARSLGGEVYTVDVIPAESFDNYIMDSEEQKKSFQGLAQKYHIQLDLSQPNAFEEIKQKTGGQFDLVTSAHLSSLSTHPYSVTKINKGHYLYYTQQDEYAGLLKDGGVYFDVNKARGLGIDPEHSEFHGELNLEIK